MTLPSTPPVLAACVLRAHPLHNGHLHLIRCGLQQAAHVLVALADAHQARTPRTPFSVAERQAMLRQSLSDAERARVHVVPLRNHPTRAERESSLQRHAQALLSALGWPVDSRVHLLECTAHADDPQALQPPGWTRQAVRPGVPVRSEPLLDAWFDAGPVPTEHTWLTLAPHLPAASLQAMQALTSSPHYPVLAEEWRMLRDYRQAWSSAPYPPVFVTVDTVITCAGRVLLIERGQAPGRGLLAVPGGFLDARDSTWQSALRELREETGLDMPAQEAAARLRGQQVFDHPDRSQRGRTITHAFHIDLGDRPLPRVEAADDARAAQWVALDALPSLEDRFHDDHFHMLNHFLHLLPDPLA